MDLVEHISELEAQLTMISISLAARFHSNCPHITMQFKICMHGGGVAGEEEEGDDD